MIPHQFFYVSNVKSDNRDQVLDSLSDSELLFFGSAFDHLQKNATARRRRPGSVIRFRIMLERSSEAFEEC
jgi:hypothetical protein